MTASKKTSPPKKKVFNKKMFFIWSFITCALGIFFAMAVYLVVILNGEKMLKANADQMDMDEASVIYDINNNEVSKLYKENRESVSLDEVPERLKQAFIATEDKRFNSHDGVDFYSIGRALVKDIIQGSAVEGGSTITQQLAKNMFLSHISTEKTLFRKAKEASFAVALENNYSKDEILEMYLNRIFFGNGAYGVKAAAARYFGKPELKGDADGKNGLTLGEMAFLAGIPKAPSKFNPISNIELAMERKAVVLKLMFDQGLITEEEKNAANAELYTPPSDVKNQAYLTYIDYVMEEAQEVTGLTEDELNRNGYKIYTTLNTEAQTIMETTFKNRKFFQKDGPEQIAQGSMVILNHKDGGIVAMIGGRDYVPKGLNRATVPRQPGSAFKPISVYGPALETGDWNPYSMLKDEKMSFGSYSPRNYNNKYLGEVSMYEAVKLSINLSAVWLLNEIGLKKSMQFSANLGMPLKSADRNLTIALGGLTEGVTPLQMAQAYGAFANGGKLNKAHAVVKILNYEDEKIYSFKPDAKQVMSEETAYYMTLLLQKVTAAGGTGAKAAMKRPVAGKTGTTQSGLKGVSGNRDIWFVGYTPEWTASVWMGFDKTDKKHNITVGSGSTALIFKEVMSKALAKVKVTAFTKPKGVAELKGPPEAVKDLTAVYLDENMDIVEPNEDGDIETEPDGETDGLLDLDLLDTEKDTVISRVVNLYWSTNEEDLEFSVYRKKTGEAEFVLITETAATSINDTSVEGGATYEYYVIARRVEANLISEKSNVAK
ncbi:MAG TPA: transglycosylase domain-containing protein, partial [Bacilli bacterium]